MDLLLVVLSVVHLLDDSLGLIFHAILDIKSRRIVSKEDKEEDDGNDEH